MNSRTIIESYYRTHRDELLAFVSMRLHHSDGAEDLVQDTFLRLLTGYRIISEVTLPHLVYTTCRHLIADWYRRRDARLDAAHELCRQDGRGDSAESLLSVREISELLERGLARVPEDCRELYRMHVYGAMQARDLSRQSGVSYKAVEYRLGQARKQVRNHLRHVI